MDGDDNEPLVQTDGVQQVTLLKRFSDPHYAPHRYVALMFMSLMGFGNYFIYDIPGSLQEQIIRSMNVSIGDCTSLYSWYSWPNVILCFFGGYLIDRVLGVRFAATLFALFIFLGQLITSLGAYWNHFWIMQLGRFVFGIGGESLAVAQNTYAVSWFKGRELNMIFGFQLSFARVGSSFSFIVLYPIYEWVVDNFQVADNIRLSITLLIAALTCLLSLISAIILGALDKRAERILQREVVHSEEKIQLRDVTKFCFNFWVLSAICVCFYITIFPFVGLASVFFKHKYHITLAQANNVNSSIYLVSAIVSPFFGFLIDCTGRNVLWISVGTILAMISHALVAFTSTPPYLISITLGLGYSILASALWPMISLIIPERQLGTAYGMMQAIQNLGLGVSAWIAGIIVDYKGYVFLENLFLMSLSLTLFLILLCLIMDARSGFILNMSAKQRASIESEKAAANAVAKEKGHQNGHSEPETNGGTTAHLDEDAQSRNRYLSKESAHNRTSELVQ